MDSWTKKIIWYAIDNEKGVYMYSVSTEERAKEICKEKGWSYRVEKKS